MYKLNVLILFYWFSAVIIFADETTLYNNSFCVFREPKFNTLYNFTSLTDPTKDIVLTHDHPNETIWVQLCSPLKKKCNGKDTYGICLKKGNEEKGIGTMPPKVISDSGKIVFTFTGDDCTPKEKYTVNIIMKCDYEADKNSHPELFSHEEDACNLYMIWKTALACAQRIQKDCTVTNNKLHYDLSPLTKYSENYVIPTGNRTSPKIILNVCHSVIFEYNSLCQLKSGACLRDSTKSSKINYANLGDVQRPPFFEDGKLQLIYDEGEICKERNVPRQHIKTTITFICDFDGVNTIPTYVGGSEECHYQLVWKTTAACSVESLRNHSETTAGECTVTNPLTNFTYNIQSLRNQDFTVENNGIMYKFGICGSPKNMPCKSGAGVCLTNNSTSMGKVNTNLIWQEGGPYLNYTDGDICENGKRRYTLIAFVCGAEGSPTKPIVMEENSCQLIIHWNTDLVCAKRIKCATDDDEINLTSLIKSTANYVVKVKGTEFHINICRPLVPMSGLTCEHGSSVCRASLNSENEFVNETSLGFPRESPKINNDRQTVLRYDGGSPCPENPNKLLSSYFTFPCSYNDKGFPEFKKYEDCTYIFEWRTSITCGAIMGNWTSPCTIKDQMSSHECNLSLLHKDNPIYRVKDRQAKEYSISICGGDKFCNGSAVCQGQNGYGSLANVIFDYSRDVIKLQYSNGGKCGSSSYKSDVRFICNESIGIGAPKLLWGSQCSAEFEWHTNVTCNCKSSPLQPTDSSKEPDTVTDFSPSHAGAVAGVVLSVIALLAAIFYFRDPDKRMCLRFCHNPFSSSRAGGRVQYCRVNTTEEARLLLDADPTQCETDSDDDLLNA